MKVTAILPQVTSGNMINAHYLIRYQKMVNPLNEPIFPNWPSPDSTAGVLEDQCNPEESKPSLLDSSVNDRERGPNRR